MTRKRTNTPMVYSKMHELLASPSQPMPIENRRHQRMRLADALHELMHAPTPGKVVASHWRGCDGAPVEIGDASGLLQDAITAMAKAGQRMLDGKPMRLDGPGIEAVRAVTDDYLTALDALPARTMVRCHRSTEKRTREVFNRIDRLPDGVHVMAI